MERASTAADSSSDSCSSGALSDHEDLTLPTESIYFTSLLYYSCSAFPRFTYCGRRFRLGWWSINGKWW